MRHRVDKHHFNRDTKHRIVLIKNLLRSLVEHGSITTTKAKAKEIKRHADKFILLAKTNSLANKRLLHAYFGKRDVVNTLVEKIAPLFPDRTSGFTTLASLGKRRGDNSELFQLSLLKQPELNKTLKTPADKQQKNLAQPKTKVAKSIKAAKPTKVSAAAKTTAKTKSAVKTKVASKTKKTTKVKKTTAAKK